MIPSSQTPPASSTWESLAGSMPGAFLLGFVCGGVPLLLFASWLRGGIFSYKFGIFIGFATPFWMIVAGILAVLGRDRNYRPIILRSSCACLAAVVPVPAALFGVLGFAERGAWVYERQNLPFLIAFLTVWALLVVNAGAIVLALILRTILLGRRAQPNR